MAAPFLSVLMPALNEERTLSTVLDAVLESPVDLEVILVDDGSTDRTWELMSARADVRPAGARLPAPGQRRQGGGDPHRAPPRTRRRWC